MGTQEWLLLGLVLVVPLVIAIGVTLWTLEQAIKRNRKNRPDRAARRVSEPVSETAGGNSAGERVDSGLQRDAQPDPSPIVKHGSSRDSDVRVNAGSSSDSGSFRDNEPTGDGGKSSA